MFPARQWGLVGVVTGGADGNTTTKGLTGSMYLSKSCAGDFASEVAGPWKGASGHTRFVREHTPSVAADQRRYPEVRLYFGATVTRFYM